jgi:hypothetical protein
MERLGHEDVKWFIGTEVEHTPAFGKKTLFIVGIQDIVGIKQAYEKNQCEHTIQQTKMKLVNGLL